MTTQNETTATPKAATKAASKPATKRKPASKAKPKATAAAVAKATGVAKPALSLREAHGSEDKKSPYSVFGTHDAFSAYTIACLKVCSMLNLSPKGTPSIPKGKGYPGLFRMLAGKTANGHWRKLGRIDANGKLTAKGLNEVQARLSGNSRGYNTSADMVHAFAAAMLKGGTAKVGEKVYRFTVKAASSN